MSQQLKIGFVGAGNMGQMAHMRHYANIQECKVAALFEPRPELAARVAARYGIEKIYPTAQAMLETEKLDGIVVPQPFDRHGEIVTPLYQYGVPVLTEKPLAASVHVARQMVGALEESPTAFHMVGYHKRSDQATAWVKREIARVQESGELGAMSYVRITMPPGDWLGGGFDELLTSTEAMPPEHQVPADPTDPELSGDQWSQYVGFVNYYIHQVNLLRYLFGEKYKVTFVDRKGVLLVVESESGVTGTIEMAPYRTSKGWDEGALVAFERGYFKMTLPEPLASGHAGTVEAFYGAENGEERRAIPSLPPEGAMRTQAKNFLRAIRGECPPPAEAHEALQDLEIARDFLELYVDQNQ